MTADSFDHQDWTPVVLRKKITNPRDKNEVVKAMQNGKKVDTVKKDVGSKEYSARARKLELDLVADPTEAAPNLAPLPRLSNVDRQELVKARTAKGLTQAQLAYQINTIPSVINDLESGKVVQNTKILQQVNRVLGTKLHFAK
jgi:ribosome-binding protein aMBF1 (putative translation factor)